MRPHKLIMKAFGPFARETVVDFDAMGNNVYLICGDTGSGKTTIFDGIIYALYGTASGGARSGLGTEAFHSDYAKVGAHREEMRVELAFSHGGRSFIVARRICWGKKGDSKTAAKESTLSENGNTAVFGKGREDKDDVTAKVTEIIGLDADQFRRIIMLAQGEFQRFLTAKSDERGVILGKLYDNRRHQDLQYRLKAAAALLKEQDNALAEQVKTDLQFLIPPADAADDDRAALAPDHPDLLTVISRFLERFRADLAAAARSVRDKEDALKSLEAQKAQGIHCNGLLDDLERKKEQAAELKKREAQVDALRKLVGLAEAAEKVIPFENAMLQADAEWNGALKRVRDLEEKQDLLSEKVKALRENAESAARENSPRIAGLKDRTSVLRNILPRYDELARCVRDQEAGEKALGAAGDDVRKAEDRLSRNQSRRRDLAARLERLESAGEFAVSQAKQRLEELSGRKDMLEGIRAKIGKVQKLIDDEASLARALADARLAEVAAEDKHHALYQAFIRGQAGILARDMREKLKEETEVSCPVCGARHTAADSPMFAALHDDIPDRKTVEEANEAWDKARQTAKAAEDRHSAKEQELLPQKSALLTAAEGCLSVSRWEDLKDGAVLSDAIRACSAQIAKARAAFEQAAADKAAKEKALSESRQAESLATALEKELSEAVQKQTEARDAATTARANTQNVRKQLLGYPESREGAESVIASLEARAAALQKETDDAGAKHSESLKEQAVNDGNLKGALSDRENREKAKVRAAEAFAALLEQQGFTDAGAYRKALSPEGLLLGRETLAAWIRSGKERIDVYDRTGRSLEAAIAQLIESAKGKERADIEAIQAKIDVASGELKQMRSRQKDLEVAMERDRDVHDKLTSILEQRRKFRKAFGKLVPLAATADGKYAFSRYVLAGFFRRIVEQANIHLETMTEGEYCLVPTETGDGRSNAGLELKVLNTITGLERETASLSGGQLFEASLSLALGLSDIAQMESASSIRIDSMFIDEGFGSLDAARLDKAIEVLRHLSAGKRQVGIISHVARLDECLPRKIHVIAGDRGSTVRIETDA